MAYRVIQWATGQLGKEGVAGIAGHPDLELVGAWVHSPEKEGRDVGELCGLDPLGVSASRDKDALLAMPADCVCYMVGRGWTKDPKEPLDELSRILRSGKNVVNATWPMLVYPQGIDSRVYEQLQNACIEGGSSFYTSGVDPGHGSAGLALNALGVAREVRSVHTYEILNMGNWAHSDFNVFFGFGQPDPDKIPLLQPGEPTRYHGSTIRLLADAIGVEIDDIVEDHSVIYADEDFDTPAGHIAAGTISGLRYQAKGMVDGEARVVVEHVSKVRDEDYAELEFRGDGYRAEVEGEPGIQLDMTLSSRDGDFFKSVYVPCAMAAVNTIPQVCDAAPGVLSILDLPPYPSKNVSRKRS